MNQRLLTVTLFVTALSAAVPASAQLQPGQARLPRPAGSIFGGGIGNTGQGLTLNGSIGAGYEDELRTEVTGIGVVPAPRRDGGFSNARANLRYNVNRDTVAANLSARAGGNYYPNRIDPFVGTYSANANVAFKLGSKTGVTFTSNAGRYLQNLGYLYGDPLATGGIDPTDPGVLTRTYLNFRSEIQLTQQLTTRMGLYGRYSYYVNDIGTLFSNRYASQGAGAGMSFKLTKDLGVRLGYRVDDVTSLGAPGTSGSYSGRSIDVGVDFRKALSLTRRTTLAFSAGVMGVHDEIQDTRYWAIGHVSLEHEIGRSWTAYGTYRRSVDFEQTLGQPVFADSLYSGVSGMLSRRNELNVNIGAVRGEVGFSSTASRYTALNTGIGLQTALTRHLALSVRYSLYRYLLDEGPSPVPGLVSRSERQSVRVSLDAWVPLLARSRSVNASR